MLLRSADGPQAAPKGTSRLRTLLQMLLTDTQSSFIAGRPRLLITTEDFVDLATSYTSLRHDRRHDSTTCPCTAVALSTPPRLQTGGGYNKLDQCICPQVLNSPERRTTFTIATLSTYSTPLPSLSLSSPSPLHHTRRPHLTAHHGTRRDRLHVLVISDRVRARKEPPSSPPLAAIPTERRRPRTSRQVAASRGSQGEGRSLPLLE